MLKAISFFRQWFSFFFLLSPQTRKKKSLHCSIMWTSSWCNFLPLIFCHQNIVSLKCYQFTSFFLFPQTLSKRHFFHLFINMCLKHKQTEKNGRDFETWGWGEECELKAHHERQSCLINDTSYPYPIWGKHNIQFIKR